jgi:ATPase subunit of ABC transporter with duplicated ATPase domains
MRNDESRSKHVLVSTRNLSIGYDTPLFDGVSIDLREGEAIEIRGRNGAGKTTLIKAILGDTSLHRYAGDITLDPHMRIGIYEQEVSTAYFDLSLEETIERIYLDRDLSVSNTKIRSLMSDYLFTEADGKVPVRRLSGGQKARIQLIAMLASDPGLLVLDEPTNHLDLPSIEELETALKRYSGAILYVSHDGYFRDAIGGEMIQIGSST